MPNHIKDLTDQTFGYLTIIKRHGSTNTKQKRATWLAKCICGKEVIAIGINLTNPNRTPLKSCGCRRGEVLVKTRGSHGMTSHPIWNTWQQMRYRCGNPRSKDWKNYGGRGITVCQRWQKSFVNFLEDMGLSWYPGVSLDRIDNSKGYSLENCRWATPEMQSRNQRTNVIINTPKGAMTVTEAAETFGIKTSTLHARIFRYKYPVKKALHQPIRRKSSTSPMQAPRNRFVVRGTEEPFIAHNCSGAIYSDDNHNWTVIHDAKIQALESIVNEAGGMPVLVAYHWKHDLDKTVKSVSKRKNVRR